MKNFYPLVANVWLHVTVLFLAVAVGIGMGDATALFIFCLMMTAVITGQNAYSILNQVTKDRYIELRSILVEAVERAEKEAENPNETAPLQAG